VLIHDRFSWGSLPNSVIRTFGKMSFMSNVGGSANINGILYQLLGTLDLATTFSIARAQTNSDDIVSVCVTVEPASGGGDLQFETGSGRVVQQWKAKEKGGAWSLKKIIDEVLPDLYLAVPNEGLCGSDRYEFVTEGWMGKWHETYAFFQTLNSRSLSQIGFDALADTPKRHAIGGKRVSDLGLFNHILSVVRQRAEVAREPEALTQQKLLHLLQRFVMKEPINREVLTSKINAFLGDQIDFSDEADSKRRELCGLLLEVAAEGNKSITAEWLLRKARIPLYSFRNWPRLQSRLRNRLNELLKKEQYDRSLDVRPGFVIGSDITIFSGESGQGKTWRLARAALDLSLGDALIVWIPATRGSKEIAEYVASEIWNYGLERDSPLRLDRIAARRALSNATVQNPWSIVCVDDVSSTKEANQLLNLDWHRWGIQLLFSTNGEVARRLSLDGGCPSLPVKDFGYSELHSYLGRRNISWSGIANDVRELIRLPILAKVYADVAQGKSAFSPKSEYDLMDATWKRISNPSDIGLLRMLAGTVLDDNPIYPWPTEQILQQGGSDEAINRLVEQGWLRDVGDGHVAIGHNRFLCWAVAKFLRGQFALGKISIDELGDKIQKCQAQSSFRQFDLGYVPMDVLWMVFSADMSALSSSTLWQLVAALETGEGARQLDESLYLDQLSSLGERVVPILVERVRQSDDKILNQLPSLTAKALMIISREYPEAISEATRICLESDLPVLNNLGLRLAKGFPRSISPNRAWDIYRSCIVAGKANVDDFRKLEMAEAAFRSVMGQHLTWLRNKLKADDDGPKCLSSLVYTLASFGGNEEARQIWFEVKAELFRSVPMDERRSLIACITNFSDTDEYVRLEEWAASKDELVGGASVWALANREPKRALDVLARVPQDQLWGMSKVIGRALFCVIPEETCIKIERLIRENPSKADAYIDVFSENGDRLSSSVISVLLDYLSDGLRASINAAEESERVKGRHALMLFRNLHGRRILEELRQRRGSTLEPHLVSFAYSRIAKISQWTDIEFDLALDLLKHIAGDGYSALTNALILAEHRQLRMIGCETAVVRPDARTRVLLKAEAMSDVMWDADSTLNLVQMRAIDTLAAIGEDAALVEGILKWGFQVSPKIGELREDHPPIPDSALQPAIDLLDDSDNVLIANAVISIGLSGRKEFQERIATLLLKSDYGSELALSCLLALSELANNCDSIHERLVTQYRSGHHKFAVLKVLGNCDVVKDLYIRLLPSTDAMDDLDKRVVAFLANDVTIRSQVEGHVQQLIGSGRNPLIDAIALLDPDHPDDRELLWQKSLRPSGGFHFAGSKAHAIEKLGKVDPEAAFKLGIESLVAGSEDRDRIPHVLMKLGQDNAILELCNIACGTSVKTLCCEIARALRGNARPEHLHPHIANLLRRENWRHRRAGAFLAGFLEGTTSSYDLLRTAYNDPNAKVCAEAQMALRSRQREIDGRSILTTLNSVASAEVWGAIDSVLQLIDPGILILSNDPTGFLQIVGSQPFALRRYAFDAIDKRLKDVLKDMESLTGKWDDDD
jgi:hypothetical protein